MYKVLRIGKLQWNRGGRYKYADIHIAIELDTGEFNRHELSVHGVIGAMESGNALGGCGQIDMEFAHRKQEDNDSRYRDDQLTHTKDIIFAPNWNREMWLDLLDIWKLYHMKPISKIPQDIIAKLESYPVADKPCAWGRP